MTEPRAGRDSRQHENEPEVKPMQYPTDCAPSEERKVRAMELVCRCDGHFINFFGRLKVQRMAG